AHRPLTFEDRVAAQRVIEETYWRHRIWPAENPNPKPRLSEVLPDELIREKVRDYLQKSNALERYWNRPITAERLQAEMRRMATSNRSSPILGELYRDLGHDPRVL